MTSLTLFTPGRTFADLVPTDAASSAWGRGDTMRGMAVSAALARGAQQHVRDIDDGWVPAKWSVDFGRPASMAECRVRTRTVRQGRRLLLVDVEMEQGDRTIVAWGRGAFVRQSAPASGRVWESAPWNSIPPSDLLPEETRLYWSQAVGWTGDPDVHLGATQKGVWQRRFEIVASEPTHPFAFVAAVADIASVATQWGDRGVQHINLDLSLHLARLPEDIAEGIGVVAVHRMSHHGQAIGTAELRDARGPIGTAAVAAIQNEALVTPDQLRSIHPRRRDD